MTAGNNGTPEHGDDDPFGYLYRGEGDEPAPAAADRPGVPRTSYHQVTRVGERRSPQGGYGYPQQQSYPQQQGYGQQQAYGQQRQPGPGGPADRQGHADPAQRSGHGGHSGHGGRGAGGGSGSRRGLMLGAVALVAVVAVGITIAVITGDNGDDDRNAGGGGGTPTATTGPQSPSASAGTGTEAALPQQFAAALSLTGGAKTNNDHKNALGPNGTFVDGMSAPGATVTWNARVPKAGTYTLWVRYANAESDDAKTSVVVNGKPLAWKMNLKDYGTVGNWDSWFSSFVSVELDRGANSIAVTCGTGDVCHYNLDRIGLSADKDAKPDGWS